MGLGQTGPPPTRNIIDEEPSPDTKLRNHVLLSHAQTMVNVYIIFFCFSNTMKRLDKWQTDCFIYWIKKNFPF